MIVGVSMYSFFLSTLSLFFVLFTLSSMSCGWTSCRHTMLATNGGVRSDFVEFKNVCTLICNLCSISIRKQGQRERRLG
jgi:hypothetical protein